MSLLHKPIFVLRQAQHEREILNIFNMGSVRPELVEGQTEGLCNRLKYHEELMGDWESARARKPLEPILPLT